MIKQKSDLANYNVLRSFYPVLTAALVFALSIPTASAQNSDRTITVSGSYEYNLSPNEIIVNISFQEYFLDEIEKSENKITIETLEQKLTESIQKSDVKKENITTGAVQLVRPYINGVYLKHRLRKSLLVCIGDTKEFSKLTRTLEADGLFDLVISEFSIIEYRHTDKDSYLKESRSLAYKNAFEKAQLILSQTGGQLGKVIKIEETNKYPNSSGSFYSTHNSSGASGFKPIIISYDLMVTFEIE